MKFNYNTEKKKYIRKWEVLEKEYETAGMDKSSIEEMKRFDWELFKKERVFCRHNQYLEVSYPYNEGKSPEQNSLMLKFIEEFSYEERYFQDSRYGWIEEIENTNLVKKIKNLNKGDLKPPALFQSPLQSPLQSPFQSPLLKYSISACLQKQ